MARQIRVPTSETHLQTSSEKQRSKVRQVAAPDHPGVRAGRLDVHMLDIFGSQPGADLAVDINQAVIRAARNPQQVKLLTGLGVQRGKFFVKIFGQTSGTE